MSEQAKPFNILVVDDSLSIIKSLSKILELKGHHVLTAHNAIDAMRLVENNGFDLAICDIEMPGMSGIEFLQKIKKTLDYAMDVILMTGYLDQDYYIQAIRLGAADFIRKPIDSKELLIALERVRKRRDRLTGQSTFFRGLHGFKMEFYIDPACFIKSSLDKAFSFFFEVNLGFTHFMANELLICMDEMIYNAIIHGVLNLSSDQRNQNNEQIRTLVQQKIKEDPSIYQNQVLLTMEVSQAPKQITISVEDEGKGFDFEAWMQELEGGQDFNLDSYGRGITILKHLSDSLSFDKDGRKVSIVRSLE